MKKYIIISLLLSLMLTACGTSKEAPTVERNTEKNAGTLQGNPANSDLPNIPL